MTQTLEQRDANHILSEANGTRSRDNVTVKVGQNLPAGQLLEDDAGEMVALSAGACVGVLYEAADATLETQLAVAHVRDCELDSDKLTGVTAQATTELAALGVVVRS